MCQELEVSRGGYYNWCNSKITQRALEDVILSAQITSLFEKSRKTYGAKRIRAVLSKDGTQVGVRRIRRLMKQCALKVITVRKFKATTNSNHKLPVFDNLLSQNFSAEKPNQKWVSDITYINTDEGYLYLATTVDLFQNKVIGWCADSHMCTELVIASLQRAIKRSRPNYGVIHHSDRGSQYASHKFRKKLQENGIVGSMSAKGNCYDNACAEGFFSKIKTESIYQRKFATRAEAKSAIFDYIELFYNSYRIQERLGYMSPNEYERNFALKLA